MYSALYTTRYGCICILLPADDTATAEPTAKYVYPAELSVFEFTSDWSRAEITVADKQMHKRLFVHCL